MSRVTCQMSVSLDGYAAGPNQSLEHPLGEGGERLHEWFFGPSGPNEVDARVAERMLSGNGAYIMGRRMFGGGDGAGDLSWRGWWGDDPPYHAPVFVLSHHARERLEMHGGTTFTFVTGGIRDALDQAAPRPAIVMSPSPAARTRSSSSSPPGCSTSCTSTSPRPSSAPANACSTASARRPSGPSTSFPPQQPRTSATGCSGSRFAAGHRRSAGGGQRGRETSRRGSMRATMTSRVSSR